MFTKYARNGKKKDRFFYLSKCEKILYWKKTKTSRDKPRSIVVDDIIDIHFGTKGTDNIKRFKLNKLWGDYCISFETEFRTIDLKANDI